MEKPVLMKNNEVLAESAIRAGCRFFFGYPITPQNEITEYFAKRLSEEGGVFLQSESELAGINMVAGCASTGARVLISSSGPGLSLMQEGLSYMACAELPCVVVDVMRAGPGDGDIKGTQGDYFQATRGGGHGDYSLVVLAPASGREIPHIVSKAFHLSRKYRTPVLLLIDGYLGQMIEPVVLPPKAKTEKTNLPWTLTGCKGRKPRTIKTYSNSVEECEAINLHLQGKYAAIRNAEQRAELFNTEDAEFIIVAFGIASRIARTAVKFARAKGLKVGLIRPITLWPFPEKTFTLLLPQTKAFFVIEQNSGQMVQDVKLAVNGRVPVYFYGRLGGTAPSTKEILAKLNKGVKELLKRRR
jgi:2-oxoglutarate ferredoxin oxidoreductase subunit alpha